jgi:carboxyl-terminal processing protease
MFVTRRGRRNIVAAVSPWSPADRAGIEVGDVLLSIDGRDVDGLGPRAAGFLLRGPAGSRSNVALQNHAGTVVRYQLERVPR